MAKRNYPDYVKTCWLKRVTKSIRILKKVYSNNKDYSTLIFQSNGFTAYFLKIYKVKIFSGTNMSDIINEISNKEKNSAKNNRKIRKTKQENIEDFAKNT